MRRKLRFCKEYAVCYSERAARWTRQPEVPVPALERGMTGFAGSGAAIGGGRWIQTRCGTGRVTPTLWSECVD